MSALDIGDLLPSGTPRIAWVVGRELSVCTASAGSFRFLHREQQIYTLGVAEHDLCFGQTLSANTMRPSSYQFGGLYPESNGQREQAKGEGTSSESVRKHCRFTAGAEENGFGFECGVCKGIGERIAVAVCKLRETAEGVLFLPMQFKSKLLLQQIGFI